ncbi:MAG: tRNA (adenosine(37)-N6)-threonylcarbamoyltransferase complex ATPase subunit type 1 TsaE [Caldilineaceae bacterium]|nr:tRNA (adenosine(37)-N6)-threonylcarbamoyltransferase complex ATPase subunit type 1 TsaE [Caldilineaceae bacterium]
MTAELIVFTNGPEETRQLGERLGEVLKPGDLVTLMGDLGAGKTTFTQGVGAGLGVQTYLRSPTFTLVNEYRLDNGASLLHVDGYRLGETMHEAMLEADTFGMAEMLDDAQTIVIIEWADRVQEMLTDDRLEVRIASGPDEAQRCFTFSATGPRSRTALRALHDKTQENPEISPA